MEKETQRLYDSIMEIYTGKPWYGMGFLERINQVSWEIVSQKPIEDSTTIARLVRHMINWRIFLIEKLKGNVDFDIKQDAPNDWTDITIKSKEEWINLLDEMAETQEKIAGLLEESEYGLLDKKVSRRDYNFKFLIEGIIQHDIYHIGQIGLIDSQLKKREH